MVADTRWVHKLERNMSSRPFWAQENRIFILVTCIARAITTPTTKEKPYGGNNLAAAFCVRVWSQVPPSKSEKVMRPSAGLERATFSGGGGSGFQ